MDTLIEKYEAIQDCQKPFPKHLKDAEVKRIFADAYEAHERGKDAAPDPENWKEFERMFKLKVNEFSTHCGALPAKRTTTNSDDDKAIIQKKIKALQSTIEFVDDEADKTLLKKKIKALQTTLEFL